MSGFSSRLEKVSDCQPHKLNPTIFSLELGYDNENPFIDEADETAILSRSELEKEQTLADRHDKAQAVK